MPNKHLKTLCKKRIDKSASPSKLEEHIFVYLLIIGRGCNEKRNICCDFYKNTKFD